MLEPKTARGRKSEAVMPRCQKQTLCSALFLSHGDLSSAKDISPAPSSPKENFLCPMARMVLSCMGPPTQHLRIPLEKCTEPGQPGPTILGPCNQLFHPTAQLLTGSPTKYKSLFNCTVLFSGDGCWWKMCRTQRGSEPWFPFSYRWIHKSQQHWKTSFNPSVTAELMNWKKGRNWT